MKKYKRIVYAVKLPKNNGGHGPWSFMGFSQSEVHSKVLRVYASFPKDFKIIKVKIEEV